MLGDSGFAGHVSAQKIRLQMIPYSCQDVGIRDVRIRDVGSQMKDITAYLIDDTAIIDDGDLVNVKAAPMHF